MVRIRYTDSVKIQISGPRRIIPNTKIEIGRRSMTWMKFLLDVCDIQLDTKKEYFICTAGYSPNHSTMEGWTASLNDPIDSFVQNYTKKLKKYSVRLHSGPAPQKTSNDSQIPIPTDSKPEALSLNNNSLMNALPQKPLLALAAKKFATITPLKPSQFAELADEQNVVQNMQENHKNGKNTAAIPLKRGRKKRTKKAPKPRNYSMPKTNLVVKRSRSMSKNEHSLAKIMRHNDIKIQNHDITKPKISETNSQGKSFDNDMVDNGENTKMTYSSAKLEQKEILLIDLVDSDEEDEDNDIKNVKYIQEKSLNKREYQFDNFANTEGNVMDRERQEPECEMRGLLNLFKQSIDNFDQCLLEQIKLEVIGLNRSDI